MQSLAPSEYFPGIKFNYSFYTTGDTKVTLEYVNNNFLKCTGYAYSRAISTSFNGIIYALGGIETTDIIASGTISANLFQGSGTELTNLNASNISDGTLTVSRGGTGLSTLASGQLLIGNDIGNIVQTSNLIWDIPNNNLGIGKNPAQKLDVNGTIAATLFSGSGASLTGLTEGQIPVLTAAKIPELPQTRIKDLETTLSTINEVINAIALGTGIENLDASKLTGTINNERLPAAISVTSFAGDGASITAINASNIATGTINNARLPTDISVNSFTGDGASITAINASNIATGTINNDRIALTTTKVFQHFDDKTFKIIDDKINLTPDVGTYTFNILAYDRVFDNGLVYLQSGKFTCSYEDRTGVYVLRTTQTIPNKLILDYKVGDKLVFKNSAKKTWDYLYDTTGIPPVQVQKWGKLTVFKIANATNWTGQGEEAYMTKIFEWRSATETVIDYTKSEASFPWGTTMTLTMEAGFRYFIIKYQWNVNDNYYVTPASEDSQMNITNNGGQGFKMITTYTGAVSYIPQTPSVVEVMSETKAGVAFRGTRMSISDDGALSADIPTTTELLTSMNASHFTNNTQTGKIDINTNLAELKGPKGDTGKGWTGATYSGTTGIVTFASGDALGFNTGDIRGGKGDNGTNGKGWTGASYSATTGKVSFASNDGTPFVFDTGDLRGGKGDKGDNGTNGKGWTGATYNSTTGKVSFASTDGTPYVFDTGDLRGGAGANGKGWTGATYNSTTGKVSFTSTDTGFAFDTGDLRGASGATITTTQLSALMNTTDHFTLNGTTNKIDFKTTYKIPTAGTADAVVWSGITSVPSTWTTSQIPELAIGKISGLQGALDGKAPTSHTHTTAQITGLDTALTGKQATLTSTNTIGVFNTTQFENVSSLIQIKSSVLAGGLWQTGTPSTNIFYSAGNVSMGTTGRTTNVIGRLQLNNENNQEYSSFDIVSASSPNQAILATFRRSDMTVGLSLTGDINNFNLDAFGTNTNIGTVIRTKGTGNFGLETNGVSRITVVGNTGNVGIGTNNPQSKVHVRDDTTNTTSLTIQNNNTPSIPTEISVVGATSTIIGTIERCISFPYSGTGPTRDYTFTTTESLICDILIVGGGGAGGNSIGGGGGAGGVVYTINQTLTTGTYTVKVGRGGIGTNHPGGDGQGTVGIDQDGVDSLIQSNSTDVIFTMGGVNQNLRGKGGGGGGVYYNAPTVPGRPGGSGGGSGERENAVFNGGISTQGNTYWNGSSYVAGGSSGYGNLTTDGNYFAPGGGGAGNTQFDNIYNGKTGVQISITGTPQFYAAGGGGGQLYASGGTAAVYTTRGLGGSSIGGNGRIKDLNSYIREATSGATGTGSGGGGGAYNATPFLPTGSGGSGIVIIKYRKSTETSSSSTIELLRGTTTDANHDWKLGNYNGDFKIKKSVDNVDTDVLIIYKNQLNGRDIFYLPDGDLNVDGTIYTTGNILGGGYLQGSGGGGGFRIGRPDSWVRLRDTAEITHLDLAVGQLYSHSTISSVSLNNTQVLTIGGVNNYDGGSINKLRVYASDGNNVSAIFKHPNDSQGIGIKYDGIIALGTATNQGITLTTRGNGAFVVNDTAGDTNLQFIKSVNGNYGEVVGDWYVSGYGNEIFSGFRAVSVTDTDHLVVQRNYTSNEINSNWIKVGFGSFTAFHRCYTDDELYNCETDEDIDIFKNKYVGCVVIATGKIKTDFTRKIPNEVEVEVESEQIHKPPKKEIDEWYSEIDKDGITIEDAVPVVRLSRQRKDKRVFGVFGGLRSTNNKDRLIVNSVGEGGITVVNTNGNIENGDYIQSSDLLGYGEKQDDDLLHNYTVAKATMDCIFELDSPYYQCYEIENGVRVAFIACSYHCG